MITLWFLFNTLSGCILTLCFIFSDVVETNCNNFNENLDNTQACLYSSSSQINMSPELLRWFLLNFYEDQMASVMVNFLLSFIFLWGKFNINLDDILELVIHIMSLFLLTLHVKSNKTLY